MSESTKINTELQVTGIVAVNTIGAIGKQGMLMFDIPEDRKFFRKQTLCNTVVMGSRTFKSLGYAPLSERNNIVLTTVSTNAQSTYGSSGALDNGQLVYKTSSVERVLQLAEHHRANAQHDNIAPPELYVIGGALTYKAFMPYITRWIVTHVDNEQLGDVYFPYMFTQEFMEKFPYMLTLVEPYGTPYGSVEVKQYTCSDTDTMFNDEGLPDSDDSTPTAQGDIMPYGALLPTVEESWLSKNISTEGIDESDTNEYTLPTDRA